MYDKVLVPIDGSDDSERALELALTTASVHSAKIHVLNVIDERNDMINGMALEAVNQLEESRLEMVDEARQKVEEEGLEAEAEVTHGVPHKEVGSYVEENDIDAVIAGSTGKTGLENLRFGSTAEKIVRTV